MDKWYFWVGIIAAVCIAVYMMPQLVKVIKTKDTSSISIAMFVIALFGDLCFVLDGIGILADGKGVATGLPILLANLAAFAISAVIAYFKFRNMHRAKKMNLTEKTFCSNYKVNNEAYKLKFPRGKKPVASADKPASPADQPANIG